MGNEKKPRSSSAQRTSLEQQHVHEMLDSFRVVLFSTPDLRKETQHARPMTIARLGEDCTLYFVAALESVSGVGAPPTAMVTAQSSARFLVLQGRYRVSTDRALLTSLWAMPMDVWFEGPKDPKVCAIIFTPVEAELWDNTGIAGLKYLFQAAKALATGAKPPADGDPELHARVPISR